MASDWQRATVGAVSLVVTKGTTPTTLGHVFQDTGINFVKVESISPDGRFLVDKLVRISKEAHEALARSKLAPNDVLFTIAGTIGRTAIVTEEILPANTNQAVAIVRPNTSLVHPRFLRYVLGNPAFLRGALSRTVESVQANFSLGELKSASISLPNLREQRGIIDVLGAIDDRIDLLRQTNATLESIAQALFKSWFVDFDPVRAKQAGREPEGMDAATAALFPAEFEESALGLIPKGWSFQRADELFDVGIGKTPPRKEPHWFSNGGGDVRWLSIKDMGDEGTIASRSAEHLSNEAISRFNIRLVPSHTVLLSFKLTVGRLAITDGTMTTNEAIAHFRRRADSPEFSFLYCYLKAFDFARLGSTSSIAEATNSKAVKALPVLAPAAGLATAFHNEVEPLFERMFANKRQWRVLESIRDSLLPRLISGKLRLPEAQEQLEDALA